MRRIARAGAAAGIAAAAALAAGPGGADESLPPGEGRDLVYAHCRTCHSLTYLTDSAGISRSGWDSVLGTMRQLGMPKLGPGDREKVLDYLAAHLGPEPPPKPGSGPDAAGPQAAAGDGAAPDGAALYGQQCASCHQPDGQGVKGQYPPLAGNRDLFLSRDYVAVVALNGLRGAIEVGGARYDGAMPDFAYLPDAALAAIAGHVRSSWGNAALRPAGMAALDAAAVEAARGRSMGPDAVHDYRAGLK